MGELRAVRPALLVVASFGRAPEALDWAGTRLAEAFGPIALTQTPYAFTHTEYYQGSMGTDLHKQLLAFERLVGPDALPELKHATNAMERELTESGRFPEERPINLDPGLMVLGKFLLATTKDQSHRIYLRDGIFAEVTLRFQAGAWEPWPWTYADYREPFVRDWLFEARELLKARMRAADEEGRSRS